SYEFNKGYIFFKCKRRHTRSKRDWSSDVCSSNIRRKTAKLVGDICEKTHLHVNRNELIRDSVRQILKRGVKYVPVIDENNRLIRSEERRVGKECMIRSCAID